MSQRWCHVLSLCCPKWSKVSEQTYWITCYNMNMFAWIDRMFTGISHTDSKTFLETLWAPAYKTKTILWRWELEEWTTGIHCGLFSTNSFQLGQCVSSDPLSCFRGSLPGTNWSINGSGVMLSVSSPCLLAALSKTDLKKYWWVKRSL